LLTRVGITYRRMYPIARHGLSVLGANPGLVVFADDLLVQIEAGSLSGKPHRR